MVPTSKPADGLVGAAPNGGAAADVYGAAPVVISPVRLTQFVLRFLIVATAFIAAVVMGAARQTEPAALTTGDVVNVTIKSTYMSQLNYFIAANSLACLYAAFSLAFSVINRGRSTAAKSASSLALAVADLVMVAFLFSGIGSAAAVRVLAEEGVGVLWISVCRSYSKFCADVAAAIVMSFVAGAACFALVVVGLVGFHRRSL